jgi:hypothetical protein
MTLSTGDMGLARKDLRHRGSAAGAGIAREIRPARFAAISRPALAARYR